MSGYCDRCGETICVCDELAIQIKTIKVDPDDIIIIECNKNLEIAQFRVISEQARKQFPDNKIVILNDGMKLRKAGFTDDVSKMSQKEFGEYIESIKEKFRGTS